MKKFARKIKTSINPLYLLAGVLVVVLIVGGGIVLLSGGDDGETDANEASRGFASGDQSRLPGNRTRPVKRAPVVRSGLLDEARRVGRLAVAQARGTIVSPTSVRIRVSAAPKQTVSVNWQLGCFKDRAARVGKGEYRTKSPDLRSIELPLQGAKSCIATASAQLTRTLGEGRISVQISAG